MGDVYIMYIHMYVYVCVCVYVYVYIYIYICVCVCVCICTYVRMHACMYVGTYVCVSHIPFSISEFFQQTSVQYNKQFVTTTLTEALVGHHCTALPIFSI